MPQETLKFTPAYCVVGAYRLAHDPLLWKPMWARCSKGAKQAGMVAAAWAVLTWPVQKLFVYFFMGNSARVIGMSGLYSAVTSAADSLDRTRDNRILGLPLPSLTTFAAMVFVLGQVNHILEFWLRRQLTSCRNTAYETTVRSRGKPADWWKPYVEEWQDPPLAKAQKNTKKQKLYIRLASPFVRMFVLKVLLLPLDFVPFLSVFVTAGIRSLSLARQLHTPLFAAKAMSPLQVELWVTERQWEYRSFGLTAALLESLPVIGLVFSVSNRVGAAMYAHDLEKRQQRFRSGELRPLTHDETYKRGHDASSSQDKKLPVAPQAEDGLNMPGAVFGAAGPNQRPGMEGGAPTAAATSMAPPAYSEYDAASSTAGGTAKRRVPPPPPAR